RRQVPSLQLSTASPHMDALINAMATRMPRVGSTTRDVGGALRCGDGWGRSRLRPFDAWRLTCVRSFRRHPLNRTPHLVYEAIVVCAGSIEIKVRAFGVTYDLSQGFARAIGENSIDLTLHLLESIEMLGGS